ncbi:putative PGG domain-containing protein [Helianthus annuus]|nr:putative PGG domain-containing protein [Helianthus annuus]
MRSDNNTLYQLSIMNRSENAYNFLVHEKTYHRDLHHHRALYSSEDNLLHLAAKLAPQHRLKKVNGATLQMQKELQWFQEVSKLMSPGQRTARNSAKETPMMVFCKQHEGLRQKGEDWMKSTANSYTIVAALIITIAFSAIITVPGGNNGDTGKAIYEKEPSYIIFLVSDALSLFTSTTSLLWFLSILTARYADEDFLYKLPKRLIVGLIMLFMSVTSMLIAFSAALYIMFGHKNWWILLVIGVTTLLPISSFVTLQLPLLVDLIDSTYGRGVFGKRSEHRRTS